MKNVFNKMNEQNIHLDNDIDFSVDTNKIKELTLSKVRSKPKKSFSKKIVGIAASFLLIFTMTGVTTYTFAGPVLRSAIQEILGVEIGELLLIGESISNRHYTMTVEDFVYDGSHGEVTLSVLARSKSAKETFETDRIYDKFGYFSIGNSISELEEYKEANKRYFSISFTKTIEKYNHLSDIDSLIFAFEGMRDMIRVPLNPTLSSQQKDIFVPAQAEYSASYHSIVYSKLGFTLLGEIVDENEDFSNITIDFVLKDGAVIHFVNEINYSYAPYIHTPLPDTSSHETHKETIIMDGKKTEVEVAKSETTTNTSKVEGVDFVHETNDEWFSGSGGSGYGGEGTYKLERSFTFTKSFDWEAVDKMIVNGTEIPFN